MVTSGTVIFVDVPYEGVTSREIITIPSMSAGLRGELERQRQLFEDKLVGGRVVTPQFEGLTDKDAKALTDQLLALRSSYPPVLTEQRKVGDNRSETFKSDQARFYAYAKLFKAIKPDNIHDALEAIDDQIQKDGAAIVELAEASTRNSVKVQADIDLKWLKSLHGYLETYLPVAQEVNAARQRYYGLHDSVQKAIRYKTWDDYMSAKATTLLSQLMSESEGAADLDAAGRFTVEGAGELVVRVEYGLYSAYFIATDESEERLTLQDLKRSEAPVNSTQESSDRILD